VGHRQECDIVVIGAGPAGLSAARAAARPGLDVLLLEKLSQAGELGHPCGAAIAPHPGFVSGQRQRDGLHFPELDLTIPRSLIAGWPPTQRYISPGGYEMRIQFPARDDFPIGQWTSQGCYGCWPTRLARQGQSCALATLSSDS
jgi:2-polyprenyl-6-methoxyphenol hydroxylase-like FAD-dependent oxidoreductase